MHTLKSPFPKLEEGPVPTDAKVMRHWQWRPAAGGFVLSGEVWSPKHGEWIGCTTSTVIARRLTEDGRVACHTRTGSWYLIR